MARLVIPDVKDFAHFSHAMSILNVAFIATSCTLQNLETIIQFSSIFGTF